MFLLRRTLFTAFLAFSLIGVLGLSRIQPSGSSVSRIENNQWGNYGFYNETVNIQEGIHDIAVTNVTLAKTVICQGCFGNITVTVENQGDYTEIFNLTLYVNRTEIETQEITSPNPGAPKITITFTFPNNPMFKGYFSIDLFAYATPVIGENDTSDNTCMNNSWVIISMIGDITGPDIWPDGECDMRDVGLVARCFGQTVPPAPAICDLTGPITGVPDGTVDMRDVGLVARHFGETDP